VSILSRLQTLVVFPESSRAHAAVCVLTEQLLLVSGKKHRYRIPDVCVMALPYRSEPVLTTPPHLVIEIVSPDDDAADMLSKVADYLRFGVPHIWIPDPYKRTLQEADNEGIRPCPDLVVGTELVGRVDFPELFSQPDEPTE
jgi:Uma2 family endonuclease